MRSKGPHPQRAIRATSDTWGAFIPYELLSDVPPLTSLGSSGYGVAIVSGNTLILSLITISIIRSLSVHPRVYPHANMENTNGGAVLTWLVSRGWWDWQPFPYGSKPTGSPPLGLARGPSSRSFSSRSVLGGWWSCTGLSFEGHGWL